MSLTVSYSTSIDLEKWRWVESDEKKYLKYETDMSFWERARVVVWIALKALGSFGRYFPLWNDEARTDWENLKRKICVCYVTNSSFSKNIPLPDQTIEFNKSIDEILSNPVSTQPQKEKTVTQVYRDLLAKSEEYRLLKKKIHEVSLQQKEILLEQLYAKDQKIALAIERALNNLEDGENCGLFIHAVSPVYEDSKFEKVLQDAIEATQRQQKDQKTESQRKFEDLYDKYERHPAKAEWLYSIFHDKSSRLADFVLKVTDLKGVYSPVFQSWIEDSNLYSLCMKSLEQEQFEPSAGFEEMQKTYQEFVQVQKELNKNLVPPDSSVRFYYTYKLYMKDRNLIMGYEPILQLSLEMNQIGSAFIWQYVSQDLIKVLQQIQGYLNDPAFCEAVRSECGHRMAEAKARLVDAENNLRSPLTQKSFECLMQHNDNSNFRDAINKMIDIEALFHLRENHQWKKYNDPKFFVFLRTLKNSDFFRQRSQARCDLKFYEDFHCYFEKIPGYISDLHKILYTR